MTPRALALLMILGLMLVAVAAWAGGPPDALAPPDPDTDAAGWADAIYSAVSAGQWSVVAGLALLGLVWGVRKAGPWLIDRPGMRWLRTDRGGVVVSVVGGLAIDAAAALAAGRPPSIVGGLVLSAIASGTWTLSRRMIDPRDTSPVPPPSPASVPTGVPR